MIADLSPPIDALLLTQCQRRRGRACQRASGDACRARCLAARPPGRCRRCPSAPFVPGWQRSAPPGGSNSGLREAGAPVGGVRAKGAKPPSGFDAASARSHERAQQGARPSQRVTTSLSLATSKWRGMFKKQKKNAGARRVCVFWGAPQCRCLCTCDVRDVFAVFSHRR